MSNPSKNNYLKAERNAEYCLTLPFLTCKKLKPMKNPPYFSGLCLQLIVSTVVISLVVNPVTFP